MRVRVRVAQAKKADSKQEMKVITKYEIVVKAPVIYTKKKQGGAVTRISTDLAVGPLQASF